MAPAAGPASHESFEYGLDAKERVLDEAAKLLKERKEREQELAKKTTELEENHFNPTNDASCKILRERIATLNAQIDKLADDWESAGGNRDRFYKRLQRYYDDHYVHVETGEDDFSVFDKKTEGRESAPTNRTEVVTYTREQLTDLQKRMEAFATDENSAVVAINALLEQNPPLMPMDLVEGRRQAQATEVVFGADAELLAFIHESVANEQSPLHTFVMDRLRAMATALDARYKAQKEATRVLEQTGEGTVGGAVMDKTMKYAKDALHSPEVWVGLGLGALAAYLFSKSEGALGKTAGVAMGLGSAFLLGDFSYKNLSDAHLGLLERWGLQSHDLVGPEIIRQYKDKLANFPMEDQDTLQFFCCLLDSPMPLVMDAFEEAWRGDHKIDARVFVAHGLINSNVADRMNVKPDSLYKGFEFLFGNSCYNQAVAEKKHGPEMEQDKKIHAGLDWARGQFTSDSRLRNAIYYLSPAHQEAERRRNSLPSATPAGGVGAGFDATVGITEAPDGPVKALAQESPRFASVLKYDQGNVYLVAGYPYEVTEVNGVFNFKSAISGSTLPEHTISKGSAKTGLDALVDEAKKAAKETIVTAYGTQYAQWSADHPGASVVYNNEKGVWKFDPAFDLDSPDASVASGHKGFPNFERNKALPVYFSFKGSRLTLRMELNDAKEQPSLKAAREDYEKLEKTLFIDRVHASIDHVLLGVPFKILSISDSGTSTVLTIQYDGDQHTGTLSFTNDALDGFDLKTGKGPVLEKAWKDASTKDVGEFLNSDIVQKELDKIASSDLVIREPGVWSSIKGAFASMKASFSQLMEGSMDARYDDEFVRQIHALQFDMRDLLVDRLYGHNLGKSDFDAQREKFERLYANAITGMVKAKFDPSEATLTADEKAALSALKGTYGVAHAETMDLAFTGQDRTAQVPGVNSELEGAWRSALGAEWYRLGDSTRKSVAEEKVRDRVAAMDTELNALGTSGHPALTRKEFAKIRDKYLAEATTAVGTYYAMDSKVMIDKMLTDKLDTDPAKRAAWEGPTKIVEDYVLYKIKWENYGILPNPQNMKIVMDKWFQCIDNGSTAPGGTPNPAREYANYFLANLDAHLPHHQDYSTDRLYGEVYSVSDTEFSENFLGWTADVLTYAQWNVASPRPSLPLPDALKTADEVYMEQAKDRFTQWFEDQVQVGGWSSIDGAWPQVFRTNIILTRLPQVLVQAPNATQLRKDLKRLGQFAMVEASVYKQLIDANRVVKDGGAQLYQKVLNPAWTNDWSDPSKTALDYSVDIQANLVSSRMTTDSAWYVPRLVGEALSVVENTLTDL